MTFDVTDYQGLSAEEITADGGNNMPLTMSEVSLAAYLVGNDGQQSLMIKNYLNRSTGKDMLGESIAASKENQANSTMRAYRSIVNMNRALLSIAGTEFTAQQALEHVVDALTQTQADLALLNSIDHEIDYAIRHSVDGQIYMNENLADMMNILDPDRNPPYQAGDYISEEDFKDAVDNHLDEARQRLQERSQGLSNGQKRIETGEDLGDSHDIVQDACENGQCKQSDAAAHGHSDTPSQGEESALAGTCPLSPGGLGDTPEETVDPKSAFASATEGTVAETDVSAIDSEAGRDPVIAKIGGLDPAAVA